MPSACAKKRTFLRFVAIFNFEYVVCRDDTWLLAFLLHIIASFYGSALLWVRLF